MSENIYYLILVLIFILHNAEEFLFYHKIPQLRFRIMGNKIINSKVFLCAIILLSVLAIIFVSLNYFFPVNIIKKSVIVICFAIFINAIQHLVLSLWNRKIFPGTITALFLIIPFSIYGWIKLHEVLNINIYDFILYFIFALLAMYLLIYASLLFGYYCVKFIRPSK